MASVTLRIQHSAGVTKSGQFRTFFPAEDKSLYSTLACSVKETPQQQLQVQQSGLSVGPAENIATAMYI